jgi:hypothetical protein
VSVGDPNVADPSGTVLFEVDEPQFNHDAGHVAFGPDGFLYFTLGDGGGAHDGLADSPPSHGPIGHGMNIETALGSVLRIDVDSGSPYAVPPDNPFVGVPGVDEIYAYGMRNPYRFSFDAADGRLFVADVGQNLFEEINVVQKGGNYGWVTREGFHCFDPFNPTLPPATCPTTGFLGEPLLDPVAEYDHNDGLAVVGGYVYRGTRYGQLIGKYIFGDWSTGFVPGNGRLFYLDADGDMSQIFEFQLGPSNDPLGAYLSGFGEDENGDIYVLTTGNLAPVGDLGKVLRIKGEETLLAQLESFTAAVTKRGVRLEWSTASEIDNAGFRVLRERVVRNEKSIELLTPQLIPARGNSLVGAEYEFFDATPGLRGLIRYYLEDVDYWGRATRHGPVEVNLSNPRPVRGRPGRVAR